MAGRRSNTKGFTGHAMGAAIEDVVAVKTLETGLVPPVPNYREPDPEHGELNLSRDGSYPVRHALRLAAGFGSQIAMALLRWTPPADGQHRAPDQLGHAYRVSDGAAWQRWLDGLAGHSGAQLEVDHRRLRVIDRGAPAASTHESQVAVLYNGRMAAPTLSAAVAAASAPARVAAAEATSPSALAIAAIASAAESSANATATAPERTPAAAPAAQADTVLAQVTAIVSTMTGYPSDLLDPDLDLEADLGVDTVKQAEVVNAASGRRGSSTVPRESTCAYAPTRRPLHRPRRASRA